MYDRIQNLMRNFFWRVNLPAGDCDAVIKRKQNVRQFRSKDNKTRKKGCFCPFCLFTKFVDDFCKINLSFDRQKHSATGSSILMNFTFEKVLDWWFCLHILRNEIIKKFAQLKVWPVSKKILKDSKVLIPLKFPQIEHLVALCGTAKVNY